MGDNMSREDEVRREMEKDAAEQQLECPVEDGVDAAFGFREVKKGHKSRMTKGANKLFALKKGPSGQRTPSTHVRKDRKSGHGPLHK